MIKSGDSDIFLDWVGGKMAMGLHDYENKETKNPAQGVVIQETVEPSEIGTPVPEHAIYCGPRFRMVFTKLESIDSFMRVLQSARDRLAKRLARFEGEK